MPNPAIRHLAPAKKTCIGAGVEDDKLTVIIPCAGIGRRMKSQGPKALFELHGGITILERQLHILWQVFPHVEIIIVVGFGGNLFYDQIKSKYPIRLIHNFHYEETNVCFSIGLGLQAAINNDILLIYGDLVFNQHVLEGITLPNSSRLLVDNKGDIRKEEVGVVSPNQVVTNVSYGIAQKWGQIAYFTGKETQLMRGVTCASKSHTWIGSELINAIIDCGGHMETIEHKKGKIIEVDSPKDLELARKIFNASS